MEALAVDTSFLIDLQNERRQRGAPTGAIEFLRRHASTILYLPAIARGEYLEGFDDPSSDQSLELIATLRLLPVTGEVATEYARNARRLRQSGHLIASNDLWIGCTAKTASLPIVTRNVDEFRRIEDLSVVSYSTAE